MKKYKKMNKNKWEIEWKISVDFILFSFYFYNTKLPILFLLSLFLLSFSYFYDIMWVTRVWGAWEWRYVSKTENIQSMTLGLAGESFSLSHENGNSNLVFGQLASPKHAFNFNSDFFVKLSINLEKIINY